MDLGTRLIAALGLAGALALGACSDNEFGEDENQLGEDDTPNAVIEQDLGNSPIEDAGIGEGQEDFGSATGGTMGEDVEVPITDAPDEEDRPDGSTIR